VSEHDVRVRFAPSPTGQLHVGSARTALYNWAFARHTGGTFILRIDDTDPERSTKENTQAIVDALEWLGLDWDEGPGVGGPRGPYFQTERGHHYGQALARLVSARRAYPCFCSKEELEAARQANREAGGFGGYPRTCRAIEPPERERRVSDGEPHVWRVAVPDDRGEVVFDDAVRGEVRTQPEALDDLVIVRSDGTPTYNFATVVDDAAMGITHVIRGEDHISNTPRQIVLFEALEHDTPRFAHMSLTFGPDGKRLSKRHGATSVEAFKAMGFLSDALVNYIALLGWSLDDKTTIVDRATLIENFSLERLSSNPGIFDIEKLEWMNGVYVRDMDLQKWTDLLVGVLVETGLATQADADSRRGWYEELATLLQERVKRLDEIPERVGFLFAEEIDIDPDAARKVLGKEGAFEALAATHDTLDGLEVFSAEAIEEVLRALPQDLDMKPRIVFQAVRVAVSGSTVSPPLFESLALLGKERSLARIAVGKELASDV
jgi:glutamyl-tRNA synthetase